MVRTGNFFFKYRNQVFPLAFIAVAALTRPGLFLDDPAKDWILDLVGILVATLGEGIRVAVIGLEYIKRGGKGKEVYADDLVTGGIFAHSRNPLYVGNVLMIAGLAIMFHNPVFYVVCLGGGLFIYRCITAAEEKFLREKFGETYEQYCQDTPRYLPKLSGLGKTLSGMNFDWKRVLRKDYGTLFSLLTWIVLILVYQEIHRNGFDPAAPLLLTVTALWTAGLLAWAIARVLKKRKLLGTD